LHADDVFGQHLSRTGGGRGITEPPCNIACVVGIGLYGMIVFSIRAGRSTAAWPRSDQHQDWQWALAR